MPQQDEPRRNKWYCISDDPATPTNDPYCVDDQWLEWLTAFIEGREPEITRLGFAYMLQGGSSASDTRVRHTQGARSCLANGIRNASIPLS